jgi:hypothetical protein
MKRVALKLLLTAAMLYPAMVFAGDRARDALFYIERNKNANIIQYDAQVTADGQLYSKEPVVGYWIRLAEQGQVKELIWIEKKFAYGFTTKFNKSENTATLDMAADIGRTILVKRDGADFRAIAKIDEVESYIDKIFIKATGKGMKTKVEYIELYGRAVKGQAAQYERFSP